jgi:hypothetical protein
VRLGRKLWFASHATDRELTAIAPAFAGVDAAPVETNAERPGRALYPYRAMPAELLVAGRRYRKGGDRS